MLRSRNPIGWATVALLALAAPAAHASDPASAAAAVCRRLVIDTITVSATPVVVDPGVLDAVAGDYGYGGHDVLTVARDGDHLQVKSPGQPPEPFHPQSPTLFVNGGRLASISTGHGLSGRALVIHQDRARDLQWDRLDPAKAAQMKALAARHFDPETGLPRTQPALLHLLRGLQSGDPDYSKMTTEFSIATRRQKNVLRGKILALGPVTSVQYLGLDEGILGVVGDVYDVWQAYGVFRWNIAVDDKGVIVGAGFRCGP